MKYDPRAATLCLPEGDYDASILKVEEKESNSGNMMEVVTFEVYTDTGSVKLKEYFVEGQSFAAFKYKRMAQALGKEEEFKAGTFQAASCKGDSLTVTLAIKEDDFGEKNVIKAFSPKRLGAKPAASKRPAAPVANVTLTEEDIPF